MPSPFKRHGASRQIQPMSQAELDASLEGLHGQELQEQFKFVAIERDPQDPSRWWVKGSHAMTGGGIGEGSDFSYDNRDEAERVARDYSDHFKIPYIGERHINKPPER